MTDHRQTSQTFALESDDYQRLAILCGDLEGHLHHLERTLGVEISHRGNQFQVFGTKTMVTAACQIIETLYSLTASQGHLSQQTVEKHLQEALASCNADQRVQAAPL